MEMKFNVAFITPLLIHGQGQGAEHHSLGKALRGVWRFWFRAMVGGMLPGITKADLRKLEGKIFGAADDKIGATFRLAILPQGQYTPVENIDHGFTRNFKFKGFIEGCNFNIVLLPRPLMVREDKAINVLLAAIWLWGHLGAVGQRQRRGFGSPEIKINNNADPFRAIELNIALAFNSADEIKVHLCENLKNVFRIFKDWIETQKTTTDEFFKITGDILSNDVPANAPFFILRTIGQIAVGQDGQNMFPDRVTAIKAIHGNSRCNGLGYGGEGGRMASPVFTRLYRINGAGYVPVATYAHQTIPGLQNCVGHDCVQNYLRTYVKMLCWLNNKVI